MSVTDVSPRLFTPAFISKSAVVNIALPSSPSRSMPCWCCLFMSVAIFLAKASKSLTAAWVAENASLRPFIAPPCMLEINVFVPSLNLTAFSDVSNVANGVTRSPDTKFGPISLEPIKTSASYRSPTATVTFILSEISSINLSRSSNSILGGVPPRFDERKRPFTAPRALVRRFTSSTFDCISPNAASAKSSNTFAVLLKLAAKVAPCASPAARGAISPGKAAIPLISPKKAFIIVPRSPSRGSNRFSSCTILVSNVSAASNRLVALRLLSVR